MKGIDWFTNILMETSEQFPSTVTAFRKSDESDFKFVAEEMNLQQSSDSLIYLC